MAGEDMKIGSGLTGINNFFNGYSTREHGTKVSFKDILKKTPIFQLDSNLQAQAASSSATASTGMN